MAETKKEVFLNIPYDKRFTRLYFSYIAALTAMGLLPRATLEIPGVRRLDLIIDLLERCPYSIHDLSRVQLDLKNPRTPRFNMPFELGLAVSSGTRRAHRWYVFEAVDLRLSKSLSDLNGTDPYIHGGTVHGVMREICNAFLHTHKHGGSQPSVPQMMKIYKELRSSSPRIMQEAAAKSVFTARVFSDLRYTASLLREKYVK